MQGSWAVAGVHFPQGRVLRLQGVARRQFAPQFAVWPRADVRLAIPSAFGVGACTSTNTTLSTIEPAAWLAANGLALWTLVGLGAFIGGAHNGALWIFADVLALSQQRLLASSHALRRLANGFAPRAAFRLVATPHALRAARPNAIAGTAKCTATGHVLCIVMEEDRRARTASRSTGAAGPPCLQQGALSTHAVRNDKGERIRRFRRSRRPCRRR
mmetsp:Transcript_118869/g.341395  ORF Transcript_118869/g.341395 Transcript_118869/m.341395 type:complete len:215 (+) Transcript_118869:428-1072(+)